VEHATRENMRDKNQQGLINRVDGTSAWRASRRLDGPSAGVVAG